MLAAMIAVLCVSSLQKHDEGLCELLYLQKLKFHFKLIARYRNPWVEKQLLYGSAEVCCSWSVSFKSVGYV